MRSLSLSAYKALARAAEPKDTAPRAARPAGLLLWAVVHDENSARAIEYLSERLRYLRGECTLLITYTGDQPRVLHARDTIVQALPVDTQNGARSFLAHWKPDVCLWLGGNLMPVLISEAGERGLPMHLINAEAALLDQPIWRWLPSLARDVLSYFQQLTARNGETAKMLRRLDGSRREIEISGPLQMSCQPPGVNEGLHEEVSETLAGRPVWLAVNVQSDELRDVLAAHREATKVTHRLLLVLVAAKLEVSEVARRLLTDQAWRVCSWEDGDLITENTQVILVEEPIDMGLWYRISPISFMASSLAPGHGGCDPYPPASLGSAIIYGPNMGAHTNSYSRLANSGGARIVKDAHGLSRALANVLGSDQAATMAHAAWETILEGAEATDAVIDFVQEQFDARESAA